MLLQPLTKIMRQRQILPESIYIYHFLCLYTKWLILGLKAEKQLRNKNHTEDWALGCHSRDNGHMTN